MFSARVRRNRADPTGVSTSMQRAQTAAGRGLPLLAIAVLATGCAELGLPQPEPDPAPLLDVEQPTTFESATLSADGREVRVEFIGGREFDPENPCSIAYRAEAEIVDGELEIGLFAQPHPLPLGPNVACDAAGYPRALVVELPEAFFGDEVRDLAGGVIPLEGGP